MTEADEITTLMLSLDAELEQRGWDQPARFAAVEEGPRVRPLADLGGHPATTLQQMWDAGVRVDENGVIGLALSAEGYRHLTVDELAEGAPDMLKRMQAAALSSEGSDDVTPEEMQTLVRNAWAEVMNDVRPGDMPSHLRVEVRNTIVVLLDGTTGAVIRDRGAEPTALPAQGPEMLEQARVPHYMHLFLTNQRPEG